MPSGRHRTIALFQGQNPQEIQAILARMVRVMSIFGARQVDRLYRLTLPDGCVFPDPHRERQKSLS